MVVQLLSAIHRKLVGPRMYRRQSPTFPQNLNGQENIWSGKTAWPVPMSVFVCARVNVCMCECV